MSRFLRTRKNILILALAAIAMAATLPSVEVRAHGGEDHGEEKAPAAVSTSANMVVRTARAGDFEVTLKHAPVEPDKETAARVFLTRFETNEPVQGANIAVMLAGVPMPVEATAVPGATPGLYDIKLPPVPEGEYKLAARIESGGATQTVEYGALKVAPLPPPAAAESSTWARTALIALGVFLALCFVVAVIYRAISIARRDRFKGEAATA